MQKFQDPLHCYDLLPLSVVSSSVSLFLLLPHRGPGNIPEARRVLENLEQAMPGLAMVRLRRAGLERRTGQLDQAEALLREAVQQSKDSPSLHAFYSIKLARLLLKLCKNAAKAKGVLLEAIDLSPVRRASEQGGLRAGERVLGNIKE